MQAAIVRCPVTPDPAKSIAETREFIRMLRHANKQALRAIALGRKAIAEAEAAIRRLEENCGSAEEVRTKNR
jgi:hypothetical protein